VVVVVEAEEEEEETAVVEEMVVEEEEGEVVAAVVRARAMREMNKTTNRAQAHSRSLPAPQPSRPHTKVSFAP